MAKSSSSTVTANVFFLNMEQSTCDNVKEKMSHLKVAQAEFERALGGNDMKAMQAAKDKCDSLCQAIEKEIDPFQVRWRERIAKEKGYMMVGAFHEGRATVKNGREKWNFIDENDEVNSEQWFTDAKDFHEGLARVKNNGGQWAFIDRSGAFIFDQWFKEATDFTDGVAQVTLGGETYLIDRSGKRVFS